MGFENLPDCEKSFGAVGERDFDANRGLNLKYVYCDVASHSIVGDTKNPLLRVCNVTGKHGEYVRHTYSSPIPCRWGGTNSTRSRLPFITTWVNPCRFSTASRWSLYTSDADMDDHFYLTLPSNGASDVKLPERIRLDDDYELGVTEIVYPHTWYNVDNDDEKYRIGAYNTVTNQFPFPKMHPKCGFYNDGADVRIQSDSSSHQSVRRYDGH
jgi:hypothetical protein